MPTYVYKFVKTGETIEVQQSFDEPTLTSVVHPESGRNMAVKKVFTPVGVTFRGDGFYKTDSRAKSSTSSKSTTDSADGKKAETSSSPSSSSSSKTEKAESSSTKAKSETAAASTA